MEGVAIFFIAIVPILCIFSFLFLLKMPSLKAALYSYIVTVIITIAVSSYRLEGIEMAHATIKGTLIAAIAGYVLFFGIYLFHLINHVGGISYIAEYMSKATNDRILQVMMIICGLSPLIESTSGFGTAFMMTAPIFIALGFTPMRSALLGLVSLLAVPWGALAVGTVIGAEIGRLPLEAFGTGTAIMSLPVFIYFIVVAVLLAGGMRALKEKWKELIFFSVIFSGSLVVFNMYVSVELAGVLSAILSLVVGLLLIVYSKRKDLNALKQLQDFTMIKVMSPYIVLTVFILFTRLWPAFSEWLQTNAVIDLPQYSFSLGLLYSPGFWLLITCMISLFIFKIDMKVARQLLGKTFKQWVPFMVTTSLFISISELMTSASMTVTLANTAGLIFGASFLVIAPMIGAVGGFLTGSGTGSNAMFIQLQVQTAQQVGLSTELIGYAQNAGASHVTLASPSRVMLGASLCGIKSEENTLLKYASFIALGALALIMITAIGMWFFM